MNSGQISIYTENIIKYNLLLTNVEIIIFINIKIVVPIGDKKY